MYNSVRVFSNMALAPTHKKEKNKPSLITSVARIKIAISNNKVLIIILFIVKNSFTINITYFAKS